MVLAELKRSPRAADPGSAATEQLSGRERQVLRLLSRGAANKEIAQAREGARLSLEARAPRRGLYPRGRGGGEESEAPAPSHQAENPGPTPRHRSASSDSDSARGTSSLSVASVR